MKAQPYLKNFKTRRELQWYAKGIADAKKIMSSSINTQLDQHVARVKPNECFPPKFTIDDFIENDNKAFGTVMRHMRIEYKILNLMWLCLIITAIAATFGFIWRIIS